MTLSTRWAKSFQRSKMKQSRGCQAWNFWNLIFVFTHILAWTAPALFWTKTVLELGCTVHMNLLWTGLFRHKMAMIFFCYLWRCSVLLKPQKHPWEHFSHLSRIFMRKAAWWLQIRLTLTRVMLRLRDPVSTNCSLCSQKIQIPQKSAFGALLRRIMTRIRRTLGSQPMQNTSKITSTLQPSSKIHLSISMGCPITS